MNARIYPDRPLTRAEISARYYASHLDAERARRRQHGRERYRVRGRVEYQAAVVAGTCVECGSPTDGKVHCQPCGSLLATKARMTYAMRRDAGLCVACGAATRPGRGQCITCAGLPRTYTPDQQAEYYRAYRATEQGAMAIRRSRDRRRARLSGAYVEDIEPLVVLEVCDGVCGVCGEDVDPRDFHVDHILALAAGGEHSYQNVQLAHPLCNHTKGAN